MANTSTRTGLQLRSTVKKEGILELSLASVPTPEPKPEEVIVRIDASPINPSDQGLLFGGADMSTAKASGTADNPAVTASISPAVMKAMAGRLEQSLPVGNEGAGVVVQAGASPAAQALMGRTVAILGGAMYSGGVPIRVEIEKWRILPVGCSTTNRPPGKAAAGGMRHGEAYQEVGAGA
jgi:NADPH2:quinone reductase